MSNEEPSSPPEWKAVAEGGMGINVCESTWTEALEWLTELCGKGEGEGYVAINTGIWDHWLGFGHPQEDFDKERRELLQRLKEEIEYPIYVHEQPPGPTGPWVVARRPGEKVTQDDIVKAFVARKAKYPVHGQLFEHGRSYVCEGACKGPRYSFPMPSVDPATGPRVIDVSVKHCFQLSWGS